MPPLKEDSPSQLPPLRQAQEDFNKTQNKLALAMLLTQAAPVNGASPDGGVRETTSSGRGSAGKVNGVLASLWAQSDVRASYCAALPEKTIKQRRLHKTIERHV